MSINDFINASNNGNFDLVKQILSSNKIDVNSKNIYIVNIHDIQFFLFMILRNANIYGIYLRHLMTPL